MKVKDKRLTRNAARCKKCGTLLESKHVHDFAACPCGNFIDGGLEYERGGGNPDEMENLCEYEEYERLAFPHEMKAGGSAPQGPDPASALSPQAYRETLREIESRARDYHGQAGADVDWLIGIARQSLVAALPARVPDPRPYCDLHDAIVAARAELNRLCGGGKWQMTIPVDLQRDSDVILGKLIDLADNIVFESENRVGAPRLPEPSPDTQQRVSEIRARLNAATPGPWRAMNDGNSRLADGTGVGQSRVDGLPRPYDPRWIGYKRKKSRQERHHTTMLRDEDATFVAHAPGDIQFLLDLLGAVDGGGTQT